MTRLGAKNQVQGTEDVKRWLEKLSKAALADLVVYTTMDACLVDEQSVTVPMLQERFAPVARLRGDKVPK